jgi:hypothetical protein
MKTSTDDLREFGIDDMPTPVVIDAPPMDAPPSSNGKPKRQTAAPPKKDRFPLVTSAALDSADYTPRWLINDMLAAGSPAVDGGLFKTGKTLIAMDGAISVASGLPFLGRFAVPEPLSAVYFIGEGGPSVTQEYGRRIARSKGLRLADVTNLHWCFSVPRLESLEDLDEVQRIHDDTAAELMVFDNLMLCMSADEPGNVFRMGQTLGNVIRICTERGITPLFVHHFKRTRATADPYAPGELLDLTQAGAAEIAGQWWLLTRFERYDPDQAGEHKLWLSVGGRVGHSSLHALHVHEGKRSDPGGRRWEVEILSAGDVRESECRQAREVKDQKREEKAAAQLEADRGEIVAIVVKLKDNPKTKNKLREEFSGGHTRFDRAFASLVKDGTLTPVDVKNGNGHTDTGWKVKDDSE